ncbi:MAG TPA: thiamine pyrophosphate-binding protein [bacterium]|nr:thiamine pyrophosphate-binding protein [bacterium]
MATNAEAIAAALADAGIDHAFGLPGGEITVLIEACRRAGIRFYLTGHEASAAFMADVTGQITGRPGVCMATLGPGAVNLGLGVSNAFLDRSPVLAITADLSTALAPHFPHQRLPLGRLFGAIAKASATVDGRGTGDLVSRAVSLAVSAPPGPVHLALPSNLAAAAAGPGTPSADLVPTQPQTPGAAHGEFTEVLAEARDLLAGAERPLVVVGLGCAPRDASALRAFVDRTGWPFIATPKAKGMLPEDAPGFLGVVGGMAVDAAVMETVEQADVLLGVGFDPVECDKDWYVRRRLVNLSRASTAEGAYRPVEPLGDIAESLAALAGLRRRAWPDALLAAARARIRPEPLAASGDAGLSPLAATRALRDAAPRETVLTCDVGSHKYYCGQFWASYEPHTFFMSNGLSGMGYGVPAAIAAKLQLHDRPVLSVVGDGLLMMLHNLTFLRQYEVPVTIVCFVDASLSLIRVGQRRRGFVPYGVDFPPPEFETIARGFGIDGVRADSVDGLRRTVAAALASRRPAVVTVPVDGREYDAYC